MCGGGVLRHQCILEFGLPRTLLTGQTTLLLLLVNKPLLSSSARVLLNHPGAQT